MSYRHHHSLWSTEYTSTLCTSPRIISKLSCGNSLKTKKQTKHGDIPGPPDSFGQCPQRKIACRIPSNLICMISNQYTTTRTDKFDDTKSVDNSTILCAIHKVEPELNSGEFSRHDDVKIVALRPLQRNPCQCLEILSSCIFRNQWNVRQDPG